jgi:hypothetical protein
MATTNTVPQPALIEIDTPAVESTPSAETGLALVVERLAANPSVDVDKLERIIALQERILKHTAEAQFNADFSAMLPEIPTIIERAKTDKTKYAPLEDIVEPLRPILARYGFSLAFRTEWPDKATVKVIGILTHKAGHARTSEFMSGADQTGSKNGIQALGSTVSYGKRYTFKDLLCIVTRDEDDDGRKAGKPPQAPAPDGYDDWLMDLEATAVEGKDALEKAWKASSAPRKAHLVKHEPAKWEALKKVSLMRGAK